jgi:hypothetical protein
VGAYAAYGAGAAVVLIVLVFVVLPLIWRRPAAAPADNSAAAPSLAEQRATIYRELTELELDQKVGKVADADFSEQSEALLARAASLISAEDAEDAALDARIEREIAEARAALKPPAEAPSRRTPS